MEQENKFSSVLFEEAVSSFQKLPGVGYKTAVRFALHILNLPVENVHHMTRAITSLKENICHCKHCMMICDEPECMICKNPKRDHNTICVVENVCDVMSIENSGRYSGVYHVLDGVIRPSEGISVDKLNISQLISRIEQLCISETPRNIEVIFALSGDTEGETTSFYIYKLLKRFGDIKVTALARGLGFEDNLEYADCDTIARSLINRQLYEDKL